MCFRGAWGTPYERQSVPSPPSQPALFHSQKLVETTQVSLGGDGWCQSWASWAALWLALRCASDCVPMTGSRRVLPEHRLARGWASLHLGCPTMSPGLVCWGLGHMSSRGREWSDGSFSPAALDTAGHAKLRQCTLGGPKVCF